MSATRPIEHRTFRDQEEVGVTIVRRAAAQAGA
jgi:hypothetical protein